MARRKIATNGNFQNRVVWFGMCHSLRSGSAAPNKSCTGRMVRFDAPFLGASNLILGKHYQSSHENPDFYDFEKKRRFHDTTGRSYPIPVLTSPKQHGHLTPQMNTALFTPWKIATNGNVKKPDQSRTLWPGFIIFSSHNLDLMSAMVYASSSLSCLRTLMRFWILCADIFPSHESSMDFNSSARRSNFAFISQ